MISRRPLYKRSIGGISCGGVAYEVDTLTVDVYRPERSAWTFGLNVEYDGHGEERQIMLTFLCWRLVVWGKRDVARARHVESPT